MYNKQKIIVMEFYKINSRNHELNVVFNGKMYIFFNSYCGIAAVAERTTPTDKIASGEENFNIKYGNDNLVGGSMGYRGIIPVVKKLVNKAESRYIQTKVTYTEERVALDKYTADIRLQVYNEETHKWEDERWKRIFASVGQRSPKNNMARCLACRSTDMECDCTRTGNVWNFTQLTRGTSL